MEERLARVLDRLKSETLTAGDKLPHYYPLPAPTDDLLMQAWFNAIGSGTIQIKHLNTSMTNGRDNPCPMLRVEHSPEGDRGSSECPASSPERAHEAGT